MSTYYIETLIEYNNLELKPGDVVCFKRGNVYRGFLNLKSGDENMPITYTAYGSGSKPVFIESTDVSNVEYWQNLHDNIWVCIAKIPGEVGNFVFNDDECTAALCWNENDLINQGDFWDSRFGMCEKKTTNQKQKVLLYSKINPALYYKHIECVSYNNRVIAKTQSNIIIENITFKNSGVHAIAGQGKNVTIKNCNFENIGGCVWDKELQIRFGNAIEFWVYGENILIHNCIFKNIYDSCITHQGPGEDTIPAKNFICKNNLFDTYGMAAFEYRDKMPIESSFEDNICINAGCGFSLAGETLPRKSEIWPEPMGHHIFLWRINNPTEGGSLSFQNNIFGNAPVGACIYSIISKEAEKQIFIDNNIYIQSNDLINRFFHKNYKDFKHYTNDTNNDKNSIFIPKGVAFNEK